MTLHVVQHVLLMMVAPPLLALGRPLLLASQAASRPNQVRVVRLTDRPLVRMVTCPPVALLMYFGSMYAYFLAVRVYTASIQHSLIHAASHAVFLAIGYLYWQPLVAGADSSWRLSFPSRILLTVAGMPFELFLGLSFPLRTHPLDPLNTLSDTQRAGQVFWIGACSFPECGWR